MLVFHRVHFIDVERAAILEYRENDGKPHSSFRRGHHHHKKGEQVSADMLSADTKK